MKNRVLWTKIKHNKVTIKSPHPALKLGMLVSFH